MATLKAYRQGLHDEIVAPRGGFYGNVDSVSGATLVSVNRFQHSVHHARQWYGWWFARTGLTGNDRLKRGTTVSAATLTGDGSSYSDTTDLYVEAWPPELHPDDYINPLINRGLQLAWGWYTSPISLVTDADSETSGTTTWTASSTETITKNTTAGNILHGKQAWGVDNNGVAAGYIKSATINVPQGSAFKLIDHCRVSAGTGRLDVYDVTNSATLFSITTTDREYMELCIEGNIPSSCKQIQIRRGGVESTAVTFWDDVCFYWSPITRLALPAGYNQIRTEDGRDAVRIFRTSPRAYAGSGLSPARAYNSHPLRPEQYSIELQPGETNSLEVEFHDALTNQAWPFYVQGRRTYFSLLSGALTTDVGTSDCPLALGVKAAKYLYAKERKPELLELAYGEYMAEQQRYQPKEATAKQGGGFGWQVAR